MEPPPPLTYEQTSKVLAKLADLGERIVLVGGQALNFWANYYLDRSSDLRRHAPFTSKDIDFFGLKAAVEKCAIRLGGKATLATLDDTNSPNTGVVRFVDDARHERVIDFLGHVAGLKDSELEAGLPATIKDDEGHVIATFYVIDPVMCLRSRAYNVARLPGYQTQHALRQLRAATLVVKEFARDRLADGDAKHANAINNAVIELARYSVGIDVFVRHGIDILDALVKEPGLPDKFFTHRLKFAIETVNEGRERAAVAKKRGEEIRERRAEKEKKKMGKAEEERR